MTTHAKEIKVRPLEGNCRSRQNAPIRKALSKNSEDVDLRRVLIEEDTVNIKNMKHQQTGEASSTAKASKSSSMATITIIILSIIVITLVVLVAWMVMRENKKKIDIVKQSSKTAELIEKLSGQVNALQNKYVNREAVMTPSEYNHTSDSNPNPETALDEKVKNTLKEKVYLKKYTDAIPEENEGDEVLKVPPGGIPEESPSEDDLNQLILESE
jgi:hypothetical protein